MVTVGDRKFGRDHAPPDDRDCTNEHREIWENEQLPKVKNLLYATIASLVIFAVLGAIGISEWAVKAADHATQAEVKEVERELKVELHSVKAELKQEITELDKLHREGFERVENKLDNMMELLMTHDKNGNK